MYLYKGLQINQGLLCCPSSLEHKTIVQNSNERWISIEAHRLLASYFFCGTPESVHKGQTFKGALGQTRKQVQREKSTNITIFS